MYKPIRSLIALSAVTLCALPATAQETVDLHVIADIRQEAFENSQVMDYAGFLTDVIGPRLTGSQNMRQAQQWALEQMRELGLSGVQREPNRRGREVDAHLVCDSE